MKVIDIIKNRKKTAFSFEVLPPLRGKNADSVYKTIENLVEYKPEYINVTTHSQEVVFQEMEDGSIRKQVIRKRPGTVALAASIQYKYGIPVVPHILCGGYSREETEQILVDLNFLGINSVLALRGDGGKNETVFKSSPNGNTHASELVKQIVDLRSGKYQDPSLKSPVPLDFCIGVAGYPEKHFEAPNLQEDMKNLKRKIDAGADYIVTQMFFNNKAYFDFVDRCRAAGITVPIIPGIKQISTLSQLTVLPKIFRIDLPQDLVNELEKCKNNDDAKIVGTEWAIQQAKELVARHVPSLHIYTKGRSDNTKKIIEAVF